MNIILVNGAFVDGSIWRKVIPFLLEKGHNVIASQPNLNSLSEDVEIVRRLAESVQGPTLLVGHSYGGAIITEAAFSSPTIMGLVFLAAFAPDLDENLQILMRGSEYSAGSASIYEDAYGYLWLNRALFMENFSMDCGEEDSHIMAISQKAISARCMEEKISNPGGRKLPTWYQVSENDQMIAPGLQRLMADRMNAKVISLPSSHASIISHPQEVADFILSAATEIEG